MEGYTMCGGTFMDALKEARPEVYNDLVHSLQRK